MRKLLSRNMSPRMHQLFWFDMCTAEATTIPRTRAMEGAPRRRGQRSIAGVSPGPRAAQVRRAKQNAPNSEKWKYKATASARRKQRGTYVARKWRMDPGRTRMKQPSRACSKLTRSAAVRVSAVRSPAQPVRAALVRTQPPASCRRPLDPTLRANPFPEVTDLFCRLPLPTLFYRLEAVHLGDLMRL